jgi:hypothetical protein
MPAEASPSSSKADHRDGSLALALLFDLTNRSDRSDIRITTSRSDMELSEFIAAVVRQERSLTDNFSDLFSSPAAAHVQMVANAGHPNSDHLTPSTMPGQVSDQTVPTAFQAQMQLLNAPHSMEQGVSEGAASVAQVQAIQDQPEAVSPNDNGIAPDFKPIPIESSRNGLLFASLVAVCFGLAGGYGTYLRKCTREDPWNCESDA